MKLVVASGNPGKVLEFREALSEFPLELLSASEARLEQFPEETGSSYEENALLKAAFAAAETGLSALGDDSGLEVEALEGAPGLHSARYGGQLSDGERVAYLLEQLRNVPKKARGARFVCALVLTTPEGEVERFRGECAGTILKLPRGESGFGYDPVFYSYDLGKTFAEASPAEKRSVSHRGRAIQKFAAWLGTPGAHLLLERPQSG